MGPSRAVDGPTRRHKLLLRTFRGAPASIELSTDTIEVALAQRDQVSPDRTLTGTARWELVHLTDGPPPGTTDLNAPVSASPTPTPARLAFGKTRVTGEIGCLEVSGPIELAKETLRFGKLAVDKADCATGKQKMAAIDVVNALDGTFTVRIQENLLTLAHPSGRGLTFQGNGIKENA